MTLTPVPLPKPQDTNLEKSDAAIAAGAVGPTHPDGISEYQREAGRRLAESTR